MYILIHTKYRNFISKWLLLMFFLISGMILVGGLTRLTDSGLSITEWEFFKGFLPPLNSNSWNFYFEAYKQIPEYKLQNYTMTLDEFKVIFWWEWAHRFFGRVIGIFYLIPLVFFSIKIGFKNMMNFHFIFLLICFQGFMGWYMVSSGLIDRVDVSHYRLSIHLVTAFIILSIVFWKFLNLTEIEILSTSIKSYYIKFFILLLFIQLIIGAFVSGMDAGKIYNSWPLMGTSFFPDDSRLNEFFSIAFFDNPSIVQFLHRTLAYLILIIYLYILIVSFKSTSRSIRLPIMVIGISLLIQIGLGIITLLSGVKILYASLHQINSIFIILSTIYLLYILKYKETTN